MKALVVNPWITDFKLYDEWMHPCGLYFLMSLLSQRGVEVFYWNCLSIPNLGKTKANGTGDFPSVEYPKPALYKTIRRRYKKYGVAEADFENYVLSIPRPDMIFVGSSMTYWVTGVKETVNFLAKIFPDVPCVVGGSAASLMPSVMKSLLPTASIFSGSLFDRTCFKAVGVPFLSTMTGLAPDSSMLPGLGFLEKARHIPVLTSFGCPLSCSYCASWSLEGDFRSRPPGTVVDEIEFLTGKFSVKNAAFYDDALLFKPAGHLLPFCKLLSDRKISLNFHTPNGMHVSFLTAELLDIMKGAGFSTLRFGYESGASDQRCHTGGKSTFEMISRKVRLMVGSGFSGKQIGVYVMAGLPGQMPEHVLCELDAVASLGILVKPVFLSPVPKTRLFGQYAALHPEILTDPLSHNDSYFITLLPGWDSEAVQGILDRAKRHNCRFS